MSESMMIEGNERIAANNAVPVASPLYYPQPATVSQVAPEIAKFPPTVTITIPQNYVIILSVGCLLLLGFLIGMLFSDKKSK